MEYAAYPIHQVSNRNGFVKTPPLKEHFFPTDNAPLYYSLIGLH
jgi:hypothetical protein